MNSHKPISCSLLIRGFFCLSGLLLVPTIGRGQEITGKIIDGESTGIPFVNIVLLSRDSTFIKGTITAADGSFTISKSENAAILKISSVGYSTTYLDIAEKRNNEDLGKITIKKSEVALSEVVVKASRPMFRQKRGSLLVQVDGTILSRLNTLDDLLPQLPGAIKGHSGGIEIFGKGSPIIYIDNRPIRSNSELTRLVPSEIKEIELITSPGSEYNATGRAVLKITTIHKTDGSSLLTKAYLRQSDRLSGGQSAVLGYQYHGLSISGSLSYDYNNGKLTQPASTELAASHDLHRYDKDQWGKTRTPALDYQVSADYAINDKKSFGLSWDGKQYTNKEHRNGTLSYSVNNNPINSATIDNHYRNRINYQHLNTFCNW